VSDRAYHHGDLRRALLEHALAAIAEVGPAHVSLRDLARRAGVSHAAPAHHFGDKEGLLTAVAEEGHTLLAERLEAAAADGDLLTTEVAYVEFAVEHRAHFDVMYRRDLYDAASPAVRAAQDRARAALRAGVEQLPPGATRADPATAALAAWSLVHGFANLWISGAVPVPPGAAVGDVAAAVARVLFDAPAGTSSPAPAPDRPA
jgi:AcrR family transcriptional regulator